MGVFKVGVLNMGSNLVLLREKLGVESVLQIVWYCAGGRVYTKLVF